MISEGSVRLYKTCGNRQMKILKKFQNLEKEMKMEHSLVFGEQ